MVKIPTLEANCSGSEHPLENAVSHLHPLSLEFVFIYCVKLDCLRQESKCSIHPRLCDIHLEENNHGPRETMAIGAGQNFITIDFVQSFYWKIKNI